MESEFGNSLLDNMISDDDSDSDINRASKRRCMYY